MPRSDPTKFIPLAPHHFEILLALSDGALHGYRIVRDIEQRSEGSIVLSTSTLYSGIRRLTDGGLVEEVGEGPGDESAGPPRRYYGITEFGREVARHETLRTERLVRAARKKFLAVGSK